MMATRPENALSSNALTGTPGAERIRIYELFIRLFGNTHRGLKTNGTLEENGCGKFDDLDKATLESIRAMGFTHLWLMGVARQATATDYSILGLPADDPDLLKGLAGSPYALRDVYDVCPDYARRPARRVEEFKALAARIHEAGLKVIIDLIPNHVARSHASVVAPEDDFGRNDDPSRFFSPNNNFFYLTPGEDGPPLRLPTVDGEGRALSVTCKVLGGCDGLFEGELEHGRVTGNNVANWHPHPNDWYETVKLNYGYDFTTGQAEYPHPGDPAKPVPDTWHKMDRVIACWQRRGADGFRCDMAHLVPAEFWGWAIPRARKRKPGVLFLAEAYDDDPAKVSRESALSALIDAGFDAVYDHRSYQTLKRLYDGPGWANDLWPSLGARAIHYAENHDEVRLAAMGEWGGVGREVGRPVSAILYGLSPGPVLFYNGQEVGEPAAESLGFGGGNGRTSLFDYGTMPELVKWRENKLSPDQEALRAFYGRLLHLIGEPAFRDGILFRLNPANLQSPRFGRLPGEAASGHWMFAFLRHDAATGQGFLVIANLHPEASFRDVPVIIPDEALQELGLEPESHVVFTERLSSSPPLRLSMPAREVRIPVIPPLTPFYMEFRALNPIL